MGRLNRNLYVMLKFTERPKTPGITSRKTWLSLKGISCLQVIFALIWMEQTLIWFSLLCIKVRASSRLVSQVHVMAGKNVKKKYLMCQIPIKMLKQYAIPNSNLHNLKIHSSKVCRKTSQR